MLGKIYINNCVLLYGTVQKLYMVLVYGKKVRIANPDCLPSRICLYS